VDVATDVILPVPVKEAMQVGWLTAHLVSPPRDDGGRPQTAILKEWHKRLPRWEDDGKVDGRLARWSVAAVMLSGQRQASWFLQPLLAWVEQNYIELLSAVPMYVNRFIAVNGQGINEWRSCASR
jgi:hypothetical protein